MGVVERTESREEEWLTWPGCTDSLSLAVGGRCLLPEDCIELLPVTMYTHSA